MNPWPFKSVIALFLRLASKLRGSGDGIKMTNVQRTKASGSNTMRAAGRNWMRPAILLVQNTDTAAIRHLNIRSRHWQCYWKYAIRFYVKSMAVLSKVGHPISVKTLALFLKVRQPPSSLGTGSAIEGMSFSFGQSAAAAGLTNTSYDTSAF